MKKFNIYEGITISEKKLSVGIIIAIAVLIALMVIGSSIGFTASFESEEGKIISSQHLRYGDRVAEPPVPSREGYVFSGWYTDKEHTNLYDFENARLRDDITLYAHWKKTSG